MSNTTAISTTANIPFTIAFTNVVCDLQNHLLDLVPHVAEHDPEELVDVLDSIRQLNAIQQNMAAVLETTVGAVDYVVERMAANEIYDAEYDYDKLEEKLRSYEVD